MKPFKPLLALLLTTRILSAAPDTLIFDGGIGDSFAPWIEDQFSVDNLDPSNHHETGIDPLGTFNWHDGSVNTAPNIIEVLDLEGDSLFNAISVDIVNNPEGMHFFASNGGSVSVDSGFTGVLNLNFQNISYLRFQSRVIGSDNGYPLSIDNLVLDHDQSAVPDGGSSLALLGLAAASLFLGRGKR